MQLHLFILAGVINVCVCFYLPAIAPVNYCEARPGHDSTCKVCTFFAFLMFIIRFIR